MTLSQNYNNKIRAGLLCATALFLTGCSGGLGSLFAPPEAKTYDLTAPSEPGVRGRRSSAQLVVPEPTALRALDSEKIVIKPNAAEINYLGDVQWSDSLPRLVQARLIETLERAGVYRAVTRPGSGIDADYQLLVEIRHFEIIAGEPAKARVALSMRLVPTGSGRSIAQRVFDAETPVSATDAATATRELNNLLSGVLTTSARWLSARR